MDKWNYSNDIGQDEDLGLFINNAIAYDVEITFSKSPNEGYFEFTVTGAKDAVLNFAKECYSEDDAAALITEA